MPVSGSGLKAFPVPSIRIYERHKALTAFLEKLGVSPKIADKDACLMEHILSAETLDRIRDYLDGKSATPPRKRRPAAK